MIRILFVCHGNICRSPMAEYVLKDMVRKAGAEEYFEISSCATSREEIGNPVYPPVEKLLRVHGISCEGHSARQLTPQDYEDYDLLLGMDHANIINMKRICGGDPDGKIHLLMDYTEHPRDVSDPWYTRDFNTTWNDIQDGCISLLRSIQKMDKTE